MRRLARVVTMLSPCALVVACSEGPFSPSGASSTSPSLAQVANCPPAAPDPSYPLLSPLSPGYESDFKSLNSDTPTLIEFINITCGDVTLYWLNFEGTRTFYATIPSGGVHAQNTYVTHPWVVVDAGGRALALFLPDLDVGAAPRSALVYPLLQPPPIKGGGRPPIIPCKPTSDGLIPCGGGGGGGGGHRG